jgi:hypothetical protein
MGDQRMPARATSYDKKVALVLQGGGALGSYQAGVYEALSTSQYLPDWVAGISIGAINAAIRFAEGSCAQGSPRLGGNTKAQQERHLMLYANANGTEEPECRSEPQPDENGEQRTSPEWQRPPLEAV